MISIVVPTLNEALNLPALASAIEEAISTTEFNYELIIVDDSSTDGTQDVASELSREYPIRLISRAGKERDLSGSVLDGIAESRYEYIVVMDADLSHSPATIPQMVDRLRGQPDRFVIGSRYIGGGSFDREWTLWRFLNSRVATLLAAPLVRCTDPMSGFFAFHKDQLPEGLKPKGYKIALEIMVRGNFVEVVEVPIQFHDRTAGESKMDMSQQLNYLLHLRLLYLHKYKTFTEFINFGLVGLSGFLIDVLFYYALQLMGLDHLLARALSFWPAASSNWLLNRTTTFSERYRRPRLRQWLEFVTSSLLGFAANWGIYFVLTTQVAFFDQYRIIAMIAGVGCGSLFNFTASSLFVYSDKRR